MIRVSTLSLATRILLTAAAAAVILVAAAIFFRADDSEAAVRLAALLQEEASDSLAERGRYLSLAGNCASCHTTPGGGFMAGGVAFETPFGRIYSTNITPDESTGIGAWTPAEFFDSMRHGVRPDGEHLYPVFPYTAFTRVTDADVAALYVYLNSIPAIRQEATPNDMSFPFNQRSLMSVWKALFFRPGPYETDSLQSDVWNRGGYLVEALAHCGACHSPRNILGAENADKAMSGGVYTDRVPGGAYRPWSAPNLTATSTGLGLWPEEELFAYLKTGKNAFLETHGPMNEVILNSTHYLSASDVSAMAHYLKRLPPVERDSGPAPEAREMGMGRTLYNLHCGTCHLPTGLGDKESAPRLAGGSLIVQASNPASLINIILYAPQLPHPPVPTERRKPMEDFQYLLDDAEVAALATYIRNNWDNSAGAVSADEVAVQR